MSAPENTISLPKPEFFLSRFSFWYEVDSRLVDGSGFTSAVAGENSLTALFGKNSPTALFEVWDSR